MLIFAERTKEETDRIIQGHKGRIEVESQEGRGSRFTVVLPISPTLRGSKREASVT